jgi:dUTP pyrophosphatase
LAQLLIIPIATPAVREVDALDVTARGAGGFGSTGR